MNMYDLVQHVFVRFKQRLSLGVVVGGASFVLFVLVCFYSIYMKQTFFEIWIPVRSNLVYIKEF